MKTFLFIYLFPDKIQIKNLSELPLCMNIFIAHHFRINMNDDSLTDSLELYLNSQEKQTLKIVFEPQMNPKFLSRTYSEPLKVTFLEHFKKVFV